MGKNFEVPKGRPLGSSLPDGSLEEFADIDGRAGQGASQGAEGEAQRRSRDIPPEVKEFIRTVLKVRDNRRTVFGNSFFGEPSWDMLLELYDAHFKGRRESVSSLCVASGVPSTTALRWLGNLVDEGWLKRTPDPTDARRSFVELTDKGLDAMSKVFAGMKMTEGRR